MDFNAEKSVTVGNKGKGIRSDCHITLELTNEGGRQIAIESKVQVLYGDDIRRQVNEMLDYFEIGHVKILIEDSGALSYILAARLEAAVRMVKPSVKEYLLPMLPENQYHTLREKNRFSRLYLPGNTPSLAINAGIHKPDGIILDLEDAVAPARKFEARYLVRNTLRSVDFYGAERMVRINQVPAGLDDLEYVIPHNVNLLLVPKCENTEQLRLVNERVTAIKAQTGNKEPVWLMPIIESALGVMKAFEIAQCENVVSLAIGLEDYTADLGVKRTQEGNESFFARCMLVNACKAAGIQAIDSVYSDVGNMEGLKENVLRSKALGFNGMGCIHPRQIKVIHENFAPDKDEIEKAKKIYLAFQDATEKGLGVVSLGTKMIDPPVVKRAVNTIELALKTGKLPVDWKEQMLTEKA